MIKNNVYREVSTGYSWKSLLFGVFYPLSRGDYAGFFIQSLICICTLGLAWIFIPFFYNRIYIKRMVEKGYQPYGEQSKEYMRRKFNYTGN